MVKKTQYKIYCLLSISLIFLGVLFCIFLSKTYHYYIPITFNQSSFPLLQVEIQGKNYQLALNSSSRIDCCLNKEALDAIPNKKNCGVAEWFDVSGEACKAPCYMISEMTIGEVVLKDVMITEAIKPESADGSLGFFLIKKFKTLLNFKEGVIILSNDTKKLENLGFNLKQMHKVPLYYKKGPGINLDTNWGIKRFNVATACTWNMIRDTIVNAPICLDSPDKFNRSFVTSRFVIREQDFGPIYLYPYAFPEKLDIDGCIGMEFLFKHPFYIDYENEAAYIF